MKLSVLADMNWETKIDHAMKAIDLDSLSQINYGDGLLKLVVALNCRDPELGHKQRVRFAKATKTLYVDIMLDYHYFVGATHVERRRKIHEQFLGQVRHVLEKRRMRDFECKRDIYPTFHS